MSDDMAADELREAIEHIDRARRLSGASGWTDRKLITATNRIDAVLDHEFGVVRHKEDDD